MLLSSPPLFSATSSVSSPLPPAHNGTPHRSRTAAAACDVMAPSPSPQHTSGVGGCFSISVGGASLAGRALGHRKSRSVGGLVLSLLRPSYSNRVGERLLKTKSEFWFEIFPQNNNVRRLNECNNTQDKLYVTCFRTALSANSTCQSRGTADCYLHKYLVCICK